MKHIKLWPLHAIIVSPIDGGFNMATLLNPTGHEVFNVRVLLHRSVPIAGDHD